MIHLHLNLESQRNKQEDRIIKMFDLSVTVILHLKDEKYSREKNPTFYKWMKLPFAPFKDLRIDLGDECPEILFEELFELTYNLEENFFTYTQYQECYSEEYLKECVDEWADAGWKPGKGYSKETME